MVDWVAPGFEGGPWDDSAAAEWFLKAAEQGHKQAQMNLGFMYATGEGVGQKDTQAANWYRRAANQGNPRAQFNLALRYARGQGAPQDWGQAYLWIKLAERNTPPNENEEVLKVLGYIVSLMEPEQVTEGEELLQKWRPRM